MPNWHENVPNWQVESDIVFHWFRFWKGTHLYSFSTRENFIIFRHLSKEEAKKNLVIFRTFRQSGTMTFLDIEQKTNRRLLSQIGFSGREDASIADKGRTKAFSSLKRWNSGEWRWVVSHIEQRTNNERTKRICRFKHRATTEKTLFPSFADNGRTEGNPTCFEARLKQGIMSFYEVPKREKSGRNSMF